MYVNKVESLISPQLLGKFQTYYNFFYSQNETKQQKSTVKKGQHN